MRVPFAKQMARKVNGPAKTWALFFILKYRTFLFDKKENKCYLGRSLFISYKFFSIYVQSKRS